MIRIRKITLLKRLTIESGGAGDNQKENGAGWRTHGRVGETEMPRSQAVRTRKEYQQRKKVKAAKAEATSQTCKK